MSKNIKIRPETGEDINAISDLTIAAFKDMEISHHTEHFIIDALRKDAALSLSLVAQMEESIVGHIAFSPVSIGDGTLNWYGLGPVSVAPSCQRQGIGTLLINGGLDVLRKMGAKGCCLVGHPTYYTRFGFQKTERLSVPGVPQEVFFVLAFNGMIPEGEVAFHPAFQEEYRDV